MTAAAPPSTSAKPFTRAAEVAPTTGDRITDDDDEPAADLAAAVLGVGGFLNGGVDVTSAAVAVPVPAKELEDRRRWDFLAGGGPRLTGEEAATTAVVAERPPAAFFWFHSGTVRFSGSKRSRSSWYCAIVASSSAFSCRAASPSLEMSKEGARL